MKNDRNRSLAVCLAGLLETSPQANLISGVVSLREGSHRHTFFPRADLDMGLPPTEETRPSGDAALGFRGCGHQRAEKQESEPPRTPSAPHQTTLRPMTKTCVIK